MTAMSRDIRILSSRQIVPELETALKLAGYDETEQLREQGTFLFQKLERSVRLAVRPKGTVAIGKTDIYVFLTLGPLVTKQTDRYFQEHCPVEGLMFNAMADSCLFSFEQYVLPQIEAICREKGAGIAARLEAGSDFPVTELAAMAEEAQTPRTLGVTVTKDSVLMPEKTVCIVFALTAEADTFRMQHDCSSCRQTDCRLRASHGTAAYRRVVCPPGRKISAWLQARQIPFSFLCGGKGVCGKCRIQLLTGDLAVTPEDRKIFSNEELAAGWRLACRAVPHEDVVIRVPLAGDKGFIALGAGPTQGHGAGGSSPCGLAVDIGSTTLAVSLVDCASGRTVHTVTAVNSQRQYGADVISRIQAAVNGKQDVLRQCVRTDLQQAFRTLWDRYPDSKKRCVQVTVAANTTMLHLLMGWDCSGLGTWPFHPVSLGGTTYSWNDVFLPEPGLAPSCTVTLLPGISTYVGADITAGIWQCQMAQAQKTALLIDLGTNGEMALARDGRIAVASTSAGPALEGGSLSWGTGSVPGTICGVSIAQGRARIRTVGGAAPVGICGTGAVEGVAALLEHGLITAQGTLAAPYFAQGFPLAHTRDCRRIVLTQQDIREIQMAKGAIRAGMETLLCRSGTAYEDIDTVYLAGGFGYYLNPHKAAAIGLFPPELAEKTKAAGNTALAGAAAVLTDDGALAQMQEICRNAREIVLGNDPGFQALYIHYMNL